MNGQEISDTWVTGVGVTHTYTTFPVFFVLNYELSELLIKNKIGNIQLLIFLFHYFTKYDLSFDCFLMTYSALLVIESLKVSF